MKKIIIIFILLVGAFFNNVSAAELYNIRPVCFDMSDSLVFIPIKTNPAAAAITNNITFTKMHNANGIILEINSATMETQEQNLFFSGGNLKEFQIIQQTPSKVRVLLYFIEKYNVSNIKIGNINNNLVITTKSLQPYHMNYYVNTYREESENSKDYREDTMITSRTIEKQVTPVSNYKNINKNALNEINQAFLSSNYQAKEVYGTYEIKNLTQDSNLRSRYYVNNISIKDNLFVINGTGTASIQKPFLLEKPLRMIFDLPNTILNRELHGKEFTLPNGDKIRAGQFTPEITRLVVTSDNAPKYIPVYSSDSQSFLITSPQCLMTSHLPQVKTNIVKTAYQKVGKTDNLIFEFDKPVSYSIKRTSEYLFIYFLNAEKYNDTNFQAAVKDSAYSEIYLSLMKNTGIRITLPVKHKDKINTYISPNGRVFKLSSEKRKVVESVIKSSEETHKKKDSIISKSKNHRSVIVIDAGHGGKDCGALNNEVTEKEINIDVAKRLKAILEDKGYRVYMTRSDDSYITLEDRVVFTENITPNAFVSIHVNSCNMESPKGIETHYYHENSLELANSVHTKLTNKVNNTPNRGLLKSRFYVINHTTVPAVLVEIGFLSNPEEKEEMTTRKRKQATAEGIAEGIIEFLNKQK